MLSSAAGSKSVIKNQYNGSLYQAGVRVFKEEGIASFWKGKYYVYIYGYTYIILCIRIYVRNFCILICIFT